MKLFWSSTLPQDSFSALAMISAEKVMMTENIINFNDKVLHKFTSHKDSKMKVTHKYNLIYKDECLFVCLFVPYTNPHF
jgi:hypothetical protein